MESGYRIPTGKLPTRLRQAICQPFEAIGLVESPIGQRFALMFGKPGLRVDFQVTRQRHVAIAHAIADVVQFSRGLLGIVLRPFGKIQDVARIRDVAPEPP